jgi:predicted membrane channel-forming protein YqfA (hemolysin III family)
MSVLEKFKHFPFGENLWHHFLLVAIALFVFIIVMLLSRSLY